MNIWNLITQAAYAANSMSQERKGAEE